jgi:flagellar hook-length control protein FliK
MSLELTPSADASSKVRPLFSPALRGQFANQLPNEADFYDQLFQFQDPEPIVSVRLESKANAGDASEANKPSEPIVDRKTEEQSGNEERDDQNSDRNPSPMISTTPAPELSFEPVQPNTTSIKHQSPNEITSRVTTESETKNQESPDATVQVASNEPDLRKQPIARRADSDPKQVAMQDESQRQNPIPAVTGKQISTEAVSKPDTTDGTLEIEQVLSPSPQEANTDAGKAGILTANTRTVDLYATTADASVTANSERSPEEISLEKAKTGQTEAQPLGQESNVRMSRNKPPLRTELESNNASPVENTRVRRRSERIGSRNRGNNDNPQDSSNRSASPARVGNARVELSAASSFREAASAGMSDRSSALSPIPVAATTPAGTSAPAMQPTIAAQVPETRTAAALSSKIRSVSESARNNPNTSSNIAVASANGLPSPSPTTSTATATGGSGGARLSQYQETKLVQRVLRGMEQLSNGGGQVRLRLHPPELGSLQMALRIEGTAVFAELHVETTAARDTLLKNLPVLKERLAEQGMQVERFEVRADGNPNQPNFNTSSQGSRGDSDSGSDRQNSRSISDLRNRLSLGDTASPQEPVRRWTRTLGQLDFEA